MGSEMVCGDTDHGTQTMAVENKCIPGMSRKFWFAAMTLKKTVLLIIDAQYDFCHAEGALFVPGADTDIRRLAALIHRAPPDRIIVTLDTHQLLDISHPGFWRDAGGNPPPPFTPVSARDVQEGRWTPLWNPGQVLDYLLQLEAQNEFSHFIWPEHCVIGTRGAALDSLLAETLRQWVHATGKNYDVLVKGTNPFTEHFGLFQAQIPLSGAPETQPNRKLLETLATAGTILIGGEARSHCVATSVKQLMHLAPHLISRTIVLTDCMSDVTGLGHLADPIFEEARDRGIRFQKSDEV